MFENLRRIFATAEPEKLPDATGEIAFADPGWLFKGAGAIRPYNPSSLVGRKGLKVFDVMRKDEQVKAALKLKKYAILSGKYSVKSPEGQPDDWEPTVFTRKMLSNINGSFEKSLERILSANDYGFSICEKIFEERDGLLWLTHLKDRKPHYFEFDIDEYGNLRQLVQLGNGLSREQYLNPAKFVVYSYQFEFGNWYGTSDLEAAYRAWWIKDNAYKWLAIMLERFGMPPVFFMFNKNKYTREEQGILKKVVRNLQNATNALLPRAQKDDLEIVAPELAAQAKDVFLPAIDKFDRDIARAILVPSLIGFTPDQSQGALSRSVQHFDAFLMVVEAARDELATHVINEQIIVPACDLNFAGLTEYPFIEFEPIKDDLKLEIFKEWANLVAKGIVEPQDEDEEQIRRQLKLPPKDQSAADERAQRRKDAAGTPNDPSADPEDDPPSNDPPPRQMSLAQMNPEKVKIALDRIESTAKDRLITVLEAMRDALIQTVSTALPRDGVKFVNAVKLRKRGDLQVELQELMRRAFEMGSTDARSEVRTGAKDFKEFTPTAAVKWLSERAITVANLLSNDILAKVQVILLEAVKNSDPIVVTVAKLADLFLPYIGDDTILEDGEPLTPFRLETIVRTNTTNAYNQGRLTQYLDPELKPFILAVKYSAIIDERTTEVCRFLDGKLFKVDDPDLQNVVPPNHFNCRSILAPVMLGTKVEASQFITAAEMGHAKDLISTSFGGNKS